MAIVIRGKTDCSICDCLIDADGDMVAFPHFIQDPAHPLWHFSDSAMHRACFQNWPSADEFRREFALRWPDLVPDHPRTILPDGSIIDLPK